MERSQELWWDVLAEEDPIQTLSHLRGLCLGRSCVQHAKGSCNTHSLMQLPNYTTVASECEEEWRRKRPEMTLS